MGTLTTETLQVLQSWAEAIDHWEGAPLQRMFRNRPPPRVLVVPGRSCSAAAFPRALRIKSRIGKHSLCLFANITVTPCDISVIYPHQVTVIIGIRLDQVFSIIFYHAMLCYITREYYTSMLQDSNVG